MSIPLPRAGQDTLTLSTESPCDRKVIIPVEKASLIVFWWSKEGLGKVRRQIPANPAAEIQ